MSRKMKTTNYPGIDYSLGKSNRNRATGIHYGVISQHSISGDALNDIEPVYPDPVCPNCGGQVTDAIESKDFHCAKCSKDFWSDQCIGEEVIGLKYEKDGYKIMECLNNDLFILNSPFYTSAQFCSPCVPGAGNLDSPCESGPKSYALGHNWFESGVAPYPVYSVASGELVQPECV